MQNTKGYAAIIVTIFTLVTSLTVISAFTFFTLQEVGTNRAYTKSIDAHYVAEAGIEDATYRIVSQKQIGAVETIALGDATTTVTITTSGSSKIIKSDGVRDDFQNNLTNIIDITTAGISFYYGVQIDDGGLIMNNNAQVNGSIHSNGNIIGGNGATITGDAIVAGGINNNPEVQWIANTVDQGFATTTQSRDIAQSFTATSSGIVPQISVLLAKVGNPTGDITLRITTDNGGKPNSSDIANTIIQNGVVGATPSWITVAFASPASVTNGATYWIVLDYGSNSSTNYWNWRKDGTNAYANNTGKYTSNWSAGGATWSDTGGDLGFKVWIGGTPTKIEDVTVGSATSGTGRANLFINDTIHGSACPNIYCIVENPARQPMPISDGMIQAWKDEAAALGICGIADGCDSLGNYKLSNGDTGTLGPKKVIGKLEVDNGATLTVTGTIWVVGDVNLSRNSFVQLSSGYGTNSGLILTDNKIAVSNNVTFQGSGQAGSFIMLLSAKDSNTEEIITVDNNSVGVIYYAGKGRIRFFNNATAKEAAAYGITLNPNATITYDSGLVNAQFSSGPSGGYSVKQWSEVP